MIYFVQPVDGGPVKIGFSDNVDQRRRGLESLYRQPLALLGTMPGGRDEERAIHERFSHLRFGKTEQFKPAADLMAFIGRPLLVGANPDAVEAMEGTAIPTLFAIKGTQAWNEWLKDFAESLGTSSLGAIDQCLRDKAEERGFRPMPKRTPRRS